MSVAQSGEDDVVARIVYRDGLRVAKSSTLLYIVSTILAPIATLGLALFLYPLFRVSFDPLVSIVLEAYGAAITLYAVLVYLRIRSHPSPGLGKHFIILGLLGFGTGAVLYAYAGLGFASTGYWLRQVGRGSLKCNRDKNVLAVYGGESLACRTCSRVVKVGSDIPQGWRKSGFAVLILSFSRYALEGILPTNSLPIVLQY